jgi:hypothetical protein
MLLYRTCLMVTAFHSASGRDAATGGLLPASLRWSLSINNVSNRLRGAMERVWFPLGSPKSERYKDKIRRRKSEIHLLNLKIRVLIFRRNASGQRADAAPRMGLPSREPNPLPLLTGQRDVASSCLRPAGASPALLFR